jgi:hypothetical protein
MRLGGQFEIGPTFLFGSGYAGLGSWEPKSPRALCMEIRSQE